LSAQSRAALNRLTDTSLTGLSSPPNADSCSTSSRRRGQRHHQQNKHAPENSLAQSSKLHRSNSQSALTGTMLEATNNNMEKNNDNNILSNNNYTYPYGYGTSNVDKNNTKTNFNQPV
jgi:hypothetical protein